MTTLNFTAPTAAAPGVSSVALGDGLWRIVRANGEVLGYIERHATTSGDRFTAKRMLARQRRFLAIGDFWRLDDAFDCFRY
ncbi:hypothetical protein M2152_001470 [Microbacteriaceae bacterium SG_E_30_P1]|uniref:DNA mismatch repair protein n=1 Tax=Antiquaquibacter oligotrophicus TaxID=2880260 RepID=A0ABT6KMQ5_9MICO|nr:hypothetical protein [Antiquaquibacter oligotrophicus]MDH6181288.1 hypothetical protein [Antiquaquibacter oligotrophicus]UDF13019.1 hypothetical protein LH407_12775 [Antiquaquibacter oligotrophicus]